MYREIQRGSIRPAVMLTPATIAAVLVVVLVSVVAAAAPAPPIGLPNCNTTCGKVSVPYPFGIGPARCSMPGFNLTCDRTSRGAPRLLLGGGDGGTYLHVVDISLENATVIALRQDHAINMNNSGSKKLVGLRLGDGGPYVVAGVVGSKVNEFVLTGCNVLATLLGPQGEFVSVCASTCGSDSMFLGAQDPVCSGNGCCQASIPQDYASYDVQLKLLDDRAHGFYHGLPAHALVAEKGWLDQNMAGNLTNPKHSSQRKQLAVPVILNWAVKHGTAPTDVDTRECPADTTRDLCKSSNSVCTDQSYGPLTGYACQCKVGYEGNPYLAGGCQDIKECERPEENGCFGECKELPGSFQCRCPEGHHSNYKVAGGCIKNANAGLNIGIGVGVMAGVVLLILTTIIITQKLRLQRTRKLKQKFFNQNRGQLLQQLVSQRADIAKRMIITLEELEKATDNFNKSRELGGGGHGTVYKGILSNLHVVAIKKPKIMVQKEIDEFINEVAILSQINHRNVVKLYGCCLETEVPMLVYEFISNGTPYDHLHVEGPRSLSWNKRLQIAIETAKSLAYLHSTALVPIIHRDIKSVNILLDDTLTAKVADFGASRYIPLEKSGVTTMVQGTIGYLDPMYFYTWRLMEKSDVYSFGFILVELLTRKKPSSYMSSEGDRLVAHFVTLFLEGNLSHILDQQVIDDGGKEVEEVAALAVACVKLRGEDRPTMRQVELTLEALQPSKGHIFDITVVENIDSNDIAINLPSAGDGRSSDESSRQCSMEEEFMLSARAEIEKEQEDSSLQKEKEQEERKSE